MAAAWIIFTYFAPLLEDRMGYGRNGVTFILVVFGAGAVIGNMLGGRVSDRIGPARALIFVTIGLLYQYRSQMKGRQELLYGLGGLFIMGLGIRAVLQVLS